MEHNTSFLGRGWKFPPTFEKKTGSIAMVSDEKDIRESLMILLSTKPGERVMQPDYGCRLQNLNFEIIDGALMSEIRRIIKQAILYFEPRIKAEEIYIESDPDNDGVILINVNYTIRSTNTAQNLVYPFHTFTGV